MGVGSGKLVFFPAKFLPGFVDGGVLLLLLYVNTSVGKKTISEFFMFLVK